MVGRGTGMGVLNGWRALALLGFEQITRWVGLGPVLFVDFGPGAWAAVLASVNPLDHACVKWPLCRELATVHDAGFRRSGRNDGLSGVPPSLPVAGLAGEVFGVARQHVTQGGVALGPGVVVTYEGGLGEVFDFDGFIELSVGSFQRPH